MATSYVVECSICLKSFKTSRSLSKHLETSHGQIITPSTQLVFKLSNNVAELPRSRRLRKSSSEFQAYKQWTAHVCDRINNTHHPRHKGKT